MSFLDKVKKASKGVIDAGAKTMLKVSQLLRLTNVKFELLGSTATTRRTRVCLPSPPCFRRSLPRTNYKLC